MQFIVDLVCGVLGAALLAVVYYGFEFQWPGAYRNLADTYGLRVTQRLWRLVGFRVGPVFMASVLVWTLAHRIHGTGWLAVAVTVTIHVLSSNGRAFISSFIPGRPEASINYGSYHLTASVIAALAGVAGSVVAPYAGDYVPSRDSLVDSIWTALLVATAAGFVLRVVGTNALDRDPTSAAYLRDRALRDVSINTFDMVFATASASRADPLLVKAFAIAEILQRPAWFRRAEYLFGYLRKRGTYGIMQISADRPISDEESVRRFCSGVAEKIFFELSEYDYGTARENEIWAVAGRHNGDRAFYDAVIRLYANLLYEVSWVVHVADAHVIGILELRRYATEWGIRVITDCDTVEVALINWGQVRSISRPTEVNQGAWWTFESRCPIEVEELLICESGSDLVATVPLQVGS